MAKDITVNITESIGVLSTASNGWTKEINMVSWNGGEPKYDIRSWDTEHEKMSKGITLTKDECEKLYEILKTIFC